jgi:protein-tyrosine phosphatase
VAPGAFVDCHSHVVPSGDDGVQSVAEGAALCREAARRGTGVLYATPHVWPHLPLTEEREQEIRAAFAELEAQVGLEVRLGFELTPSDWILDEDPRRYVLDGTDAVLMEVPFSGPADLVEPLGENIEAAGLLPVIAHPERTEAVAGDFDFARRLAERGWVLQINATSLTGFHGPEASALGWSLIEEGLGSIVASDGHRAERPPHLDEAYALAKARLGERALALFDGSALGIAVRV